MATFEDRFEAACRNGIIPGAVMAASNADGSFIYEKAFKGQNLRDSADNNYSPDSVLRLASCTKLVTSVAALQCVNKGLIGLDDDVSELIPELGRMKILLECEDGKEPVFEERRNPITLRLLLTHSAGLGAGIVEPHLKRYRERVGTLYFLDDFTTVEEKYLCPLIAQPGTVWNYSSGHDWACKVVEKLTNTTLEEHIQTHIAAPLGITSMTFWPESQPHLANRIPQASKRGKDSGTLKASLTGGIDDDNAPIYPMHGWPVVKRRECFGGEGLSSSMPDYLKLLRSLLANDGKLLKRETVDAMFMPQLTPQARESLNQVFHGGFWTLAPGEYPKHIGLDWGLGAMITTEADPGWRSKGTLMWSGLTNLFWFVDREMDLCGLFGTQLLPSGDNKARELTAMWEKEMYRLGAKD